MRKKLDSRIPALVEHGVESRHRTLFVIVGDRGKDQVVNLHYLLSKSKMSRPSVLWAYKKDLGFSSHREKRARQLKARIARGLHDPDTDDPFELFVSSTDITYVYYKTDTHRVLGRTYGMAVLQDFEAVTPNILARTIETVEGGGIVCILLRTMESLTRLYSLAMDVHARFRSDAHGDVVPRFNERFTLSIADCASAIVVDDELSVLPISSASRTLAATLREARRQRGTEGRSRAKEPAELTDLKESLADTPIVGSIVPLARTVDQARALLTLIESVSEKTLRTTVSLTAARGRGKSVSLGLAIAHAVASGYSNVFVTAPTPENLGSVFEFLVAGLDAVGYEEHVDFEVIRSTVPELRNAIIRVNVMRSHRQTVQYIRPQDAHLLAACELLVIDEAAAIPLREVKALLGPYLVFLSSTVNGYEGTGRSLSLKLIAELRRNQAPQKDAASSSSTAPGANNAGDAVDGGGGLGTGRVLREIVLRDPIRYAPGDKVEAWLNALLCLNAGDYVPPLAHGAPHPDQCDLYRVNRDTLFSHHAASEAFLQRVQGVLCASHYRNTPNDLLMLADAPGHCIFVLLGPISDDSSQAGATSSSTVPDVLCVIQVALEGQITKERVLASVAKGQRPAGDLIPWAVATQFGESSFAGLSGARVVRIATHPGHQAQGYGSQAIKLLMRYYRGEMPAISGGAAPGFGDSSDSDDGSDDGDSDGDGDSDSGAGGRKGKKKNKEKGKKGGKKSSKGDRSRDPDADLTVGLHGETIKPRRNLPPLLARLGEHPPEQLDWIGVSYGVTLQLCKFWSRLGFRPVYLRLEPNDITGEHSCVMIRSLDESDGHNRDGSTGGGARDWAVDFSKDFACRLASLLGHDTLRTMPVRLALALMDSATQGTGMSTTGAAISSRGSHGSSNGAGGNSSSSSSSSALWKSLEDAGLTSHDLARLETYAKGLSDYHVVLDLVPKLTRALVLGQIVETDGSGGAAEGNPIRVSPAQAAVLLGVGLQLRTVSSVGAELGLPSHQVLALFQKGMAKISRALSAMEERQISARLDAGASGGDKYNPRPLDGGVGDMERELHGEGMRRIGEIGQSNEGAARMDGEGMDDDERRDRAKAAVAKTLSASGLDKYAVRGAEEDWEAALAGAKAGKGKRISVKRVKGEAEKDYRGLEPDKKKVKKGKKGAKRH